MKTVPWKAVIFLLAVGLVGPAAGITTARGAEKEIRHLLQMPVAVSRASEIGIPDHTLKKITSGLNQGKLTPGQFNAFLQQTPAIAEGFESIDRVGAFVTSQVRAGLRGEKLANNIIAELRRLGIPAGELDSPGFPPLARDDFLPERARARVRRAIEAQQRDVPGDPAEPGAQPGQPPPTGPGSQPGMPGPQGSPMP